MFKEKEQYCIDPDNLRGEISLQPKSDSDFLRFVESNQLHGSLLRACLLHLQISFTPWGVYINKWHKRGDFFRGGREKLGKCRLYEGAKEEKVRLPLSRSINTRLHRLPHIGSS